LKHKKVASEKAEVNAEYKRTMSESKKSRKAEEGEGEEPVNNSFERCKKKRKGE
jgi:hypothetical protein